MPTEDDDNYNAIEKLSDTIKLSIQFFQMTFWQKKSQRAEIPENPKAFLKKINFPKDTTGEDMDTWRFNNYDYGRPN